MNEFGYPEKPKFLFSHKAKEYSEWEKDHQKNKHN